MQNQQEFDSMSNMSGETLAPPNEYQSNTDPREQTPAREYTSLSYEEGYEQGYTGLDERDFWPYEGEKLRPEPKNQKSMGGLLALVVLLCAVFLAGSFFGVIGTFTKAPSGGAQVNSVTLLHHESASATISPGHLARIS